MKNRVKLDRNGKVIERRVWTIHDEAIHRGMNYATANEKIIAELRRDEGVRLHAILKNAYQEGFLHGFEHKFDNTNYEEK
jgi:hypothetical protein